MEQGLEKSAEAVVVRRDKTLRDVPLVVADEGPNRRMQEAVSENSKGSRHSKTAAQEMPAKLTLVNAAPRSKDGEGVT